MMLSRTHFILKTFLFISKLPCFKRKQPVQSIYTVNLYTCLTNSEPSKQLTTMSLLIILSGYSKVDLRLKCNVTPIHDSWEINQFCSILSKFQSFIVSQCRVKFKSQIIDQNTFSIPKNAYTNVHTHTHTHIYIYIYIAGQKYGHDNTKYTPALKFKDNYI